MTDKNTAKIEADIKEHGLGYAPFSGPYANWRKAGHTCRFEYCIENFPLNTDCEISCKFFGHDCPAEIRIDAQGAERSPCFID